MDSIYCQEQTQGQDLGRVTGTLEYLDCAPCYRVRIPEMEGGGQDTTHLRLCNLSETKFKVIPRLPAVGV